MHRLGKVWNDFMTPRCNYRARSTSSMMTDILSKKKKPCLSFDFAGLNSVSIFTESIDQIKQ